MPYYKSVIDIDKRATLIVRPLLRSSSSYSPLFHRVFPYSHGLGENMQGLLFFSATPNAIACYYCWILCMYTLLSMYYVCSYGAHYSTYAAFAVVASDALEARAIKAAKVQLWDDFLCPVWLLSSPSFQGLALPGFANNKQNILINVPI